MTKLLYIVKISLLYILLSAGPVFAQLQYGLNKDSLRHRLSRQHEDTSKVQTYIQLGQQYENNQPDSALYFYRLAGNISMTAKDTPGIIRYIANYTAVLNVQGKFDESLKLNLQAVDMARRSHLKVSLMKSLINTGAVYQYTEHYGQATAYYLKALPLVEALGSPQGRSIVYGNLCGLYRNLKEPAKALHYARLAYQLAVMVKDSAALGSACNNYGNALKDLGRVRESIAYIDRARRIGLQLEDDNTQETALINLGDAYLSLREPQRYIPAFKAALPLAEKISDVSGKAFALHGIALGLFWQKQYPAATHLLDSAIAFARLHDQKEVLDKMLLLMSDVQIAMGRPDRAQVYRARYDSLSNVLLNVPLLKNIQELETRYQVERKQRELLQKDLVLRRKQQWLLLTTGGVLCLLVLLLLGYRVYRQRQELHRKAIATLKAEQEAVRLRAGLEGEQQERRRISQEMHDDLGAGLTRLLFLSRSLQPPETAERLSATTGELIQKMNEVIWMMNDGQDTLAGLLAHLRATIAGQLADADIAYLFRVSDPVTDLPLQPKVRRQVYLAVKEAVHNIVKHAQASQVLISIAQTDRLTITLQDNGQGFDPRGKHAGNGLRNMHGRMVQLGGTLEIATENGSRLMFSLPL